LSYYSKNQPSASKFISSGCEQLLVGGRHAHTNELKQEFSMCESFEDDDYGILQQIDNFFEQNKLPWNAGSGHDRGLSNLCHASAKCATRIAGRF